MRRSFDTPTPLGSKDQEETNRMLPRAEIRWCTSALMAHISIVPWWRRLNTCWAVDVSINGDLGCDTDSGAVERGLASDTHGQV
jgi:hypothetical protein